MRRKKNEKSFCRQNICVFVYISNVRAAAEMFNSGTITVTQMGIFLSVDLHLCKKKNDSIANQGKVHVFHRRRRIIITNYDRNDSIIGIVDRKKKKFLVLFFFTFICKNYVIFLLRNLQTFIQKKF